MSAEVYCDVRDCVRSMEQRDLLFISGTLEAYQTKLYRRLALTAAATAATHTLSDALDHE